MKITKIPTIKPLDNVNVGLSTRALKQVIRERAGKSVRSPLKKKRKNFVGLPLDRS